MIGLIIVLLVVVIAYVAVTYNWFVTTKTRIGASIQEVGNQLKRQADLIPNLINSVKGYMKHEKEIFDELTEARKIASGALQSQDPKALVNASQKMQSALSPIMAIFESTPQLQAAGPATKLMDELRDTADKLMYSRRTLIDLTADYNVRVVTLPSNLVARMLGFKAEPGLSVPVNGDFLKVGTEDTATPKVDL
jgi:LemA protein